MTTSTEYSRDVFNRLVRTDPPVAGSVLFDTACVLGGSIAGLLAARVLADHARTVLVIERDEVNTRGRSRAGVPQDRQGHALVPGGRAQLDRWLPGFTREAQDHGAVLSRPDQVANYVGVRRQAQNGFSLLSATRPLLESLIRGRVLALPNVRTLRAAATGVEIRDDAVRAVRYVEAGAESVVDVDFTVDAMGRSSRLADWVESADYQRPRLKRLHADINYATALFDRSEDAESLPITGTQARPADLAPDDDRAPAYAFAVEDQQWLVLLSGYGNNRPPAAIDAFRSACDELPAVFGRAAAGKPVRDIETYRQADSRRRDFAGLERFPSRLVSVGDAVASFNPIFGQGMSAAALHASCLSDYLNAAPDLDRVATEFFALQSVVVDAAWTVSADIDAARLDAINRFEVSDDVKRQRWAVGQVFRAAGFDQTVAQALAAVTAMLAHPSTLTEPALLDRAIEVNQRA
jgi:2-polyprenyl-6-methoxyphenol hydroxylase-like FAD-dependent oxidoreductase